MWLCMSRRQGKSAKSPRSPGWNQADTGLEGAVRSVPRKAPGWAGEPILDSGPRPLPRSRPNLKIYPGGNESACQCRRHRIGRFHPWVGKISGGGNGYPLHYSCLKKSQGQRSLAGYSPWGCKESNTTEWLSTQFKNVKEVWVGLHTNVQNWLHPHSPRQTKDGLVGKRTLLEY